MWTDSRYYIQAAQQLEEGWELKKWHESMWFNWVKDNMKSG